MSSTVLRCQIEHISDVVGRILIVDMQTKNLQLVWESDMSTWTKMSEGCFHLVEPVQK